MFPLLLLNLDKVIGLVQVGIAGIQSIVSAVREGRMKVKDAAGRELSADEVKTACEAAQRKALEVGDAAADRIEDRHADGVDGFPV